MTTKKKTTKPRTRPARKTPTPAVTPVAAVLPEPEPILKCELCGEPAGEGGAVCPACAQSRSASVAPVLAVDEARVTAAPNGPVRSEAAKLGQKAVGYLKRHARRPYGDKGVQGIIDIVRAAAHAALREREQAAS